MSLGIGIASSHIAEDSERRINIDDVRGEMAKWETLGGDASELGAVNYF